MVKCSNKDCSNRRPHYESLENTRTHRMINIDNKNDIEIFCSFECAIYAGAYSLKTGFIPKEERKV